MGGIARDSASVDSRTKNVLSKGKIAVLTTFSAVAPGCLQRLLRRIPLAPARFLSLLVFILTPPALPSASAAGPNGLSTEDAAFLDRLERASFDYFWHEANPANGLVKDRSTPDSTCSIAATGFGLSAILVAIDRGWIPRDAGEERLLVTLRTFADGKQGPEPAETIGYRGWFYHFLEMDSATRGVKKWKSELSSIDTALLLAGILDVREYFNGTDPRARQIRGLCETIFRRVDWAWMADGGDLLRGGWNSETGFIAHRWQGYNEAMLLYLLALGAEALQLKSDDPSAPPLSWETWTSSYKWRTNFGYSYIEFAPLFVHQYSHCWVDFRGIADPYLRVKGIDYFENSRRATLAQRAYCMTNPGGFPNYGPLEWGLTACDGPARDGYHGYRARGAPPAENDDGTIAPTAVCGSLPFAPEICLPALRKLDDKYHARLWTRFGFGDAFNVQADWFSTVTLGIDQGPIVLMIENYRSGATWKRMMKSPVIQRGLERAGFRPLPGISTGS